MRKQPLQNDYQPVTCSEWQRQPLRTVISETKTHNDKRGNGDPVRSITTKVFGEHSKGKLKSEITSDALRLKRGHVLCYAALFVFTVILYARPGEFYPSPLTASIALIVGLATLALYIPAQL